MPESNAAAKRRQFKQNRAMGIGDENGKLAARVKPEAKMSCCTQCKSELKITKTNTELIAHATKHNKTLDECFPGAAAIAEELAAAAAKNKGGGSGGSSGMTKAERKKKEAAGLDDLLSAGLSSGKKKKGKK
mmetsp:Transcript_25258/g.62191  ORF Transcript_25258/g.62191 Transcript_25258/m.62191 type:complete len:132 (-) Transcript_25258:125-520(-)